MELDECLKLKAHGSHHQSCLLYTLTRARRGNLKLFETGTKNLAVILTRYHS